LSCHLQGIEVVDVDVGCTVPTVRNLRALPTPNAVIWPQVLFDLDYEGALPYLRTALCKAKTVIT